MGFEYEVRLGGRDRQGLLDELTALLEGDQGLVVVQRLDDGLSLARPGPRDPGRERWGCDLDVGITPAGISLVFHEGTGRDRVLAALQERLRKLGYTAEIEEL